MPIKSSYWILGRNKSWRASATIALRTGVYFLPSSLWHNLRVPVINFFGALGLIFVSLFLVAWHHIWITIAGLAGFVREEEV
jgi:hypothetical protein